MSNNMLFYSLTILFFLMSTITYPCYAKTLCKVGVVPQFEQRRLFATWYPILKRLETKTDCDFELVGTENIERFRKEFLKGTFDFAYMNPYHAITANRAQGYLPLIRSDSKKLKGILVVRNDSPIRSVKQLHGKIVAFPSPSALGASLLMQAELAKFYGVQVRPLYVKTHSSVYLHVGKNLTKAGGGVYRTLNEQPDYIKNSIRVIYETKPVHAHPFVAHPRIPKALRSQVQQAWLALSKEAPTLFAQIPMKDPVVATMEDYLQTELLSVDEFVKTTNILKDDSES